MRIWEVLACLTMIVVVCRCAIVHRIQSFFLLKDEVEEVVVKLGLTPALVSVSH